MTSLTPQTQLAYDRAKETIKSALLEQKRERTWQSWLANKEAELAVVYQPDLKPEPRPAAEEGSDKDAEKSEPAATSTKG